MDSLKDDRLNFRYLLIGLLVFFLVMSFVKPVEMAEAEEASNGEGKTKPARKGLQIGIKKRPESCDRKSKKGDLLHIHYRGTLEDGTEFDSSYKRGTPLTFTLGHGQVIQGWDMGLMGVCEGEKRKLVIPSNLGYGDNGAPPTIPGGATLVFEVEVMKIEDKKAEL
jgi:FKBP-type peptidyl-prolyl cis-trans isomerase